MLAIERRGKFIMVSMTRSRPWLLVRGCPTVWDLQAPVFRISRRNGCKLVHPAAGCQIFFVPRPRYVDCVDFASVLRDQTRMLLAPFVVFLCSLFQLPNLFLSFFPRRTMLRDNLREQRRELTLISHDLCHSHWKLPLPPEAAGKAI